MRTLGRKAGRTQSWGGERGVPRGGDGGGKGRFDEDLERRRRVPIWRSARLPNGRWVVTGSAVDRSELGGAGADHAVFSPPAKPRKAPDCYFTASCLELRGAESEENCYEVRLFRLFRKEYVGALPGGEGLVADYDAKARRVVRAIERRDDAREVYVDLYERFVGPCVVLILGGQWEEAYEVYGSMRRETEGRFLEEDIPA